MLSRTLFLFILLNLTCALNAKGDTYITNQALPYDVMSPKALIVLNFAQSIYQPFSGDATYKAMSEWLNKGVANYLLNNITIITIASIIESDAMLETKIAYLSEIQTDWDIQQAHYRRNNNITTGLFFTCFTGVITLIVYDIIKKSKTAVV